MNGLSYKHKQNFITILVISQELDHFSKKKFKEIGASETKQKFSFKYFVNL